MVFLSFGECLFSFCSSVFFLFVKSTVYSWDFRNILYSWFSSDFILLMNEFLVWEGKSVLQCSFLKNINLFRFYGEYCIMHHTVGIAIDWSILLAFRECDLHSSPIPLVWSITRCSHSHRRCIESCSLKGNMFPLQLRWFTYFVNVNDSSASIPPDEIILLVWR